MTEIRTVDNISGYASHFQEEAIAVRRLLLSEKKVTATLTASNQELVTLVETLAAAIEDSVGVRDRSELLARTREVLLCNERARSA